MFIKLIFNLLICLKWILKNLSITCILSLTTLHSRSVPLKSYIYSHIYERGCRRNFKLESYIALFRTLPFKRRYLAACSYKGTIVNLVFMFLQGYHCESGIYVLTRVPLWIWYLCSYKGTIVNLVFMFFQGYHSESGVYVLSRVPLWILYLCSCKGTIVNCRTSQTFK